MNIADIGSAIADRFAAIEAPVGYVDIQKSTYRRQSGAGKLPMAVTTWTGTRDLTLNYYQREGIADFRTTIYFPNAKDADATDAMLQEWHDVVIDALNGEIQLAEWGTTNGVHGAYIRSVTPGEAQLGEPYYAALDVVIEVRFEHSVALAA